MNLAPAIRLLDGASPSQRELFIGQFGLMPFWAKDPTLARRTYNARSETAETKPSFRDAWRRGHRCIIPAECLYLPHYDGAGKATRWQLARADGAPMGIAGLWSLGWSHNGAPVPSFAMLTVNADEHPLLRTFHKPEDEKRMVVILAESDYEKWLNCPVEAMSGMMTRYPAASLKAEPAPGGPGQSAATPTESCTPT
jgi:putative SOS response-associated peptidase YedK